MASVTIKGSDYGISADFELQVDQLVDGKGTDQYPRNDQEKQLLETIILQFQQQENATQKNLTAEAGVAAVDAYKEAQIKDPIKADLNLAEAIAERSSLGFGTFKEQVGNIGPGGDQFRPDILAESIKNHFLRKAPDDPKRMMGDVSVIASDLFLTALAIGATRKGGTFHGTPLFTNQVRRNGFKGLMMQHPAKTTVGVNIAARGTSDALYDTMNETYRWLNGIEPDQSDDPLVENVLNMRNELLWSGGAVGLAKLFPYIKPFIGKHFLGITDEAKRLATLGRVNNVPMSVFNVSENGIVQSLPMTIGLFPIVATRARQMQNAQLKAAYDEMDSAFTALSPVRLLTDAGFMIDKGFRKNIKDFSIMKGTLFANARKHANAITESFVPTNRLAELAQSIRAAREGSDFMVKTRKAGADYGDTVQWRELISNISGGKGELIEDTLMQLDGLPQHLSGKQYMELIEGLNRAIRNIPDMKLTAASDEALMLQDFHTAAIRSLHDMDKWKVLEEPGQKELAQQFAASYSLANDFFFKNADTFKGRSSMLLKQADPNITVPGAPVQPGFFQADQMAKIFFNDETILSPMALKEMRKAVGDDAFFAMSRSFFDDMLSKNTDWVKGKVRIPTEQLGIWQRAKSFITGKPLKQKFKTVEFDIPVMNYQKMADDMGLNNINRRKGIEEVFNAKGRDGKDMLEKLDGVVELLKHVETPNFGDVSSFVKRRGFLGGLKSIVNLGTGGWLLGDPISGVGAMLVGRFGMTALSDPKFLDGMVRVLDPTLDEVARKAALVTLGRAIFDPERAVEEGYDINNIQDIFKLIVLGDMPDSHVYNNRAAMIEDNAKFGGGRDRTSPAQDNNALARADDSFLLPQNYFQDQQLKQKELLENMQMTSSTGGGSLNADQRVAMAGGNLDQAIALRGANPNAAFRGSNANSGIGSLRGMV